MILATEWKNVKDGKFVKRFALEDYVNLAF